MLGCARACVCVSGAHTPRTTGTGPTLTHICVALHSVSLPPTQVCTRPELDAWDLYLVDWGYNTPKERQRAAANPRIKVINVEQFGLLMGGQKA